MGIGSIFIVVSFIFCVICVWLLASKEGKHKLMKLNKGTKIILFGGAILSLIIGFNIDIITSPSNPDVIGRQSSTPAGLRQVIKVDELEIEVVAANIEREKYYALGNWDDKYDSVTVYIRTSCRDDAEECIPGSFTLDLPNNEYGSALVRLSPGEEELISISTNIKSGSEYSPASLKFIDSEYRTLAYFKFEVEPGVYHIKPTESALKETEPPEE